MTELFLNHVSVVESGGEGFQVSFTDDLDGDEAYFLIQRHFEAPDHGLLYVECHERRLCGHFRIRSATLRRGSLCLELMCRPPEMIRIRFQADGPEFTRLGRALKIMIPSTVVAIEGE
jgi:hypothetical protein